MGLSDLLINGNRNTVPSVRHKISILYVDDEEYLLDLCKLFLEETDEFNVDIINSAEDALNSPSIEYYDAIVSDYQMPDMDGIEFLKTFRKRFPDIPFIIFTGKGREEVVIEAIDNGVDFYLQKGGDARPQYAELSHKIKQAVRRKQAERLHRDTEKRLSDIIEFLPDATFAIDKEGRVIAWNRAIEELSGISSSDMLGKGDYDYAIPFYGYRRPLLIDLIQEPIVTIESYYNNVYQNGDAISAESNTSFSKGERIHILTKACPLYNQAGEITGAIESIRDITKVKNTEHSLRESESKFRNLVEYSHDSILILDFNGIIQFINPTGLSIIDEQRSEEIIGKKDILEYIHPVFKEIITRDLHSIIDGIEGQITQYKLITRKNREIWVEGHGRKIPHQKSESILISWREITSRKLAEDALRDSEEKFRSFAELKPQTIFEMDMDLIITYVNQHGRTMKDSQNQNIKEGYPALSFIHPSSHEKIRENIQKLIGGIPYELEEYLALRGNGTTFPINIYTSPIFKDGEITGIRGVIVDISERKKMEEEIKDSERKFRALVEKSLDGTIIVDFSGNILFSNPRICHIMGCSLDENLEERINIFSFILPEFRDNALNDLQKIKAGSDDFIMNYQVSTLDKRLIWIECIGRKIFYSGISAIIFSIHDVTERKKAEDGLRESEQKMSSLFLNNPVALTLVSAKDGVFVDVNDAFIRMSGYTRSDIIGKTAQSLGVFPDNDQYHKFLTEIREKKEVSGFEISSRMASGNNGITRFSSSIITIGGTPHILSSIEDITENINIQSAFKTIVQSMVGKTGINSLNSIAENIRSWLKADCIMISELLPDSNTVRVLSMLLDGEFVSDFSYSIIDTPCESVREKGFCIYPDDATKLFPNSPDLQQLNIRGYIGTPLWNSDGEVLGILCVLFRDPIQHSPSVQKIIDIIAVKAAAEIERAQIEQSLIDSQIALKEAMDMASLAHWECDITSGTFTFNDRFYDLYGTSAEQEGGYQMSGEKYFREFFYPGDFELVSKELYKAIETTDPDFQSDIEHRIIRRDNEIRSMNIRTRITKDANGRTIRTHGVNQDITQRKKAEEVIRKANRKLSLLTSITRHDILNKISTVYAITEFLKDKYKDPESSEYLKITIKAIEEIQDLIEFTRIYDEIGTGEPYWVKIDSLISHLSIPKSITLKKDLPDLYIFADSMLQKVFFTLLDNSIRHGQHVSEVRLSTTITDNELIISWEDNGLGIPDEEKVEIFDKGFGKNTGFGLFLSREILSLTDISIRETGTYKIGARFEIIVPKGNYRIYQPSY